MTSLEGFCSAGFFPGSSGEPFPLSEPSFFTLAAVLGAAIFVLLIIITCETTPSIARGYRRVKGSTCCESCDSIQFYNDK